MTLFIQWFEVPASIRLYLEDRPHGCSHSVDRAAYKSEKLLQLSSLSKIRDWLKVEAWH